MTTTVHVTRGTKADLENYKRYHGFKSKDDVIRHLLSLSQDKGDDVPDDSGERDAMDDEDDDLPKGKLDVGCFYASLGGDPKSVKHFTGLKDSAYQWVRQQLSRAVHETLFFLFSVWWAMSWVVDIVVSIS